MAESSRASVTLSVVMPCYNEQGTLRDIVAQVLALSGCEAHGAGVEIELIAIDDGSRDDTPAILRELSDADPRVRFLQQPQNRGKGAAVRRGIQAARGDYVVIQDADLEYEPRDLLRMLSAMREQELDVLYGSRRLRGRSESTRASFYYGGVLLSWLTNLLYFSRITDEPTCYKMWKRELLQSIPLFCDGFEFCPEVTAKVLRRGRRIREIPIAYRPRSIDEGKKIRWTDGWTAIWTLVRLRFAGSIGKEGVRVRGEDELEERELVSKAN